MTDKSNGETSPDVSNDTEQESLTKDLLLSLADKSVYQVPFKIHNVTGKKIPALAGKAPTDPILNPEGKGGFYWATIKKEIIKKWITGGRYIEELVGIRWHFSLIVVVDLDLKKDKKPFPKHIQEKLIELFEAWLKELGFEYVFKYRTRSGGAHYGFRTEPNQSYGNEEGLPLPFDSEGYKPVVDICHKSKAAVCNGAAGVRAILENIDRKTKIVTLKDFNQAFKGKTDAVAFDVDSWKIGENVPWLDIKTHDVAMKVIRKVFRECSDEVDRFNELDRLREGFVKKKRGKGEAKARAQEWDNLVTNWRKKFGEYFDDSIESAVLRLLETHGDNLCFVRGEEDTYTILVWNGRIWTSDQNILRKLVLKTEREASSDAVAAGTLDPSFQRKYMVELQKRRGLNAILENLFVEYDLLKDAEKLPSLVHDISADQLNNNDDWLCFSNVAVKLQDRQVTEVPIGECKHFYHTRGIADPFDYHAETDLVNKFFADYPEEDAQKNKVKYHRTDLFRAVAYSLIGGVKEELVCVIGKTEVGKTTVFYTLKKALGDYASSSRLSFFYTNKNQDPDKPNPSLVRVLKTRISFASDAGLTGMRDDNIKEIVANPEVEARKLNKDGGVSVSSTRYFLSENSFPKLGMHKPEIQRRIRFILFPKYTKALSKSELKDIIDNLEHRQAIMAMLIDLQASGNLKNQFPDQEELKTTAKKENLPEYFVEWLETVVDKVEDDGTEKLYTDDVYDSVSDHFPSTLEKKPRKQTITAYFKGYFDLPDTERGTGNKSFWRGKKLVLNPASK